MQVQHAGSRLSQLKKYVLRRDRAQQPAASSAAFTRSPAACSSRADSKASCTTKAAAPSPQRQSSTPRKKRAMVLYSSSEEDEELMVEAASAVEQELSALGESCSRSIFPTHFITMCMIVTVLDSAPVAATSSATPTPLLTPSPSADKPSAPAAQIQLWGHTFLIGCLETAGRQPRHWTSRELQANQMLMRPTCNILPVGQLVVLLESWKSSLPPEEQEWLSRALFVKDRTGRAVLSKELQLWYHSPGPRLIYSQPPSSPDAFFQRRFFLWAPYRMWQYSLKCPSCAHKLTSCGLYKTVRRVLDLDGWYYMGTEYLECRYCTKKVAAWSRSVREQLDFSHQMLFPAELAYRLSCDKKVLSQMKGRTLGNSANRLHSFLVENHTEEWMTRMQPVPTSRWLLFTYARETFSRMEELQASVTSVFGSILKMDSTKKVIKKLAGADAGTAQWMSSVGNELGQVLICVVTAAEGYGLQDMAKGLHKRYEQARRSSPEVLYVGRDCCRADGKPSTSVVKTPMVITLPTNHLPCSPELQCLVHTLGPQLFTPSLADLIHLPVSKSA
ncbi:uncharacterized protein LOC124869130 isoform X2 [Girardinichthys multiradiatus]|uniref:uncharacterized protein LOC124867969 isoform X2 n=1 Tax=Girardinichthys multiradiatus TaxID=208333 RepID=UPI001FACDD89|nr:uncharacterized protein LOC124867969 isoform X2 [Girardinichthys multiradiatus]XP_047222830.1 uncharacterized protein LOC124869130 isoform X2 [Girardinichthys multiradiatus]